MEYREDKKLLINNKNVVNNFLKEECTLLEVSRLPLNKKLLNQFKSNKAIFIADMELKNSSLRFELSNNKVYCNVSEHTKTRRGAASDEYKLQLNEFYAYLIGGVTKLYFEQLSYSRDVIGHCMEVYLQLMRKIILKNRHLPSVASRNKLDFLLAIYVLSNNDIKCISNKLGYARKISNIEERDYELLNVKYKELESSNSISFSALWKWLQNEFIFLKEINEDSFRYQVIFSLGPANISIIDDLSTTACIIVDYSQGNKATLNVLKHNFIKDSINSSMVNDVIMYLSSKID